MKTFKILALSEDAYQAINRALRFAQMKSADVAGELVKLGGSAANNEAWQQHMSYANVADSIDRGDYDIAKIFKQASTNNIAEYAFIFSQSDDVLNRIYEVDTVPTTLKSILHTNLIEEPQMDLSDAERIIAVEIGDAIVVGMVDVKRIS